MKHTATSPPPTSQCGGNPSVRFSPLPPPPSLLLLHTHHTISYPPISYYISSHFFLFSSLFLFIFSLFLIVFTFTVDLMSVSGKRGVGIPIILLHDAEGGIVTIELKSGDTYRGFLEEAQDNMNCTMKDCIKVSAAGQESRVQIAYIRGSQINFIVLPDMLQKAPFFNRIKLWRKNKGHVNMGVTSRVGQLGGIAQKTRR